MQCVNYSCISFPEAKQTTNERITHHHLYVNNGQSNTIQRLITSQLDAPFMRLGRSSNLKVASKPSNFPPPRFALLVHAPEKHSLSLRNATLWNTFVPLPIFVLVPIPLLQLLVSDLHWQDPSISFSRVKDLIMCKHHSLPHQIVKELEKCSV